MRSRAVHRLYSIFAVSLLLLNGCGATTDGLLEDVFEQIYMIEPTANVAIQNGDGAIQVYGSDDNEMRVECVKRAYSRERLNQIVIDVSTKPDAISVTAKVPPQPKWGLSDRSGTVDCTVVIPATASISKLDLNAGEILLANMRGRKLHARLGDGRIFARNCFTNVDLTMNRGTLMLSYDWWEKEKFSARVNVGQGNAWVFLPGDAAFHLLAQALHGKIANDFNNVSVSTSSSATGMNIDQIVNGGGATTVNVRVDKGDIKIAEANP